MKTWFKKMVFLEFLVKQVFQLSCLNELCQALLPSVGSKLGFLSCILALRKEICFWREIRWGEEGATSVQEAPGAPTPRMNHRSVIGRSYSPLLSCSLHLYRLWEGLAQFPEPGPQDHAPAPLHQAASINAKNRNLGLAPANFMFRALNSESGFFSL